MAGDPTLAEGANYRWRRDRRPTWMFVFRGVGLAAICALLVTPIGVAGGPWVPFGILFGVLLLWALSGIYVEYRSPHEMEFLQQRICIEWRGTVRERPYTDLTLGRPVWIQFTSGGGLVIEDRDEGQILAIVPRNSPGFAELSERLRTAIEEARLGAK